MRKITLTIFFLFLAVCQSFGQISHGGKPLMNDADFEASKVMYLLPVENQDYTTARKGTSQNSNKKSLKFAYKRFVDLSPEYNGEWIEKDGLQIWRVHIVSPEAYSLGVLFSEFQLCDGASLFVFDVHGERIKGAFTSENNKKTGTLYVGHVPGDEVIVELQVKRKDRNYGKLHISSISHAFLPVFANKKNWFTGPGTSQDCEIDINCEEGADWQIIKKAVCHLDVDGMLCTGTLVNNTSYNGKPYIITAEHCVNKEADALETVAYFNYENSVCGVLDGTLDMSVSQANLKATGGDLDFSIIELSSRPPLEWDTYYAGWNANAIQHTKTSTLHHPNGDVKKISVDNETTKTAEELPGDLNDYLLESNYWIQQWDIGTTEGGSSGSPLFNSSRQLIGMLSGGLAGCGDSIGYDNEKDRIIYSLDDNENDFYTKLYYDWDFYNVSSKQIKRWLDPINSGQLTLNGISSADVGLRTYEHALQLNLFPNPTRSFIQASLPVYTNEILNIQVFNITGKLVHSEQNVSQYPVTINFHSLPSGIYLLKINGENQTYSGRFIVEL